MTATVVPALIPATYRIDTARSVVRFTARGIFGLRVRGTFRVLDGTVVVADEQRRSHVQATVDTTSVDTANGRRDADLRSKRFLDVERYPAMTFTGRPGGPDTLTGQLRVHDVEVPVTLALRSDGTRFTATTRIDRYATGVRSGRGMVGQYVDVELEIVLS